MRVLRVAILLIVTAAASAQNKQTVIQQAMVDELERNMKELKTDGNELPFFINYSIDDRAFYHITASRGSITASIHSRERVPVSSRLLMGDYEFNDESIDEQTFNQAQSVDIGLPIDDDYLGIRRSLWVTTDNVYRNASRQLAKNKEAIKEQNRPLSDLPHRTFAKVPPSKVDIEREPFEFDLKATEDFLRKVTAIGNDHKQITGVHANFQYLYGYRYQVNSEGTNNRLPISYSNLSVRIHMRNEDGESFADKIEYHWKTPSLPSVDETIAKLKVMMDELVKTSTAPKFNEEYIGPVLFVDENVASLFQEQFTGESSLMHSNDVPGLKGYNNPMPTNETKIGKPLFSSNMTLIAAPKMKKFGNVDLLGGYDVDSEGVIPADETVLIQNGVLKSMMNDRTLTKPTQVANGLGDGLGVAIISFKNPIPLADMKAKLIAQAKKDALDYAIIVKRNQSLAMGRRAEFDVYKVYVADGREEFQRDAIMNSISQRDFKKILEASSEMSVHYMQSQGGFTLICPTAVLLEEVEFKPAEMRARKEQVYVPNPLKN
jgi:predicted Zn-dependent protease